MDTDPFFSFNILSYDPCLFIQTLELFIKDSLDIARILSEAVF